MMSQRVAVIALIAGSAVALGTPAVWWATRPAGSAGVPVAEPAAGPSPPPTPAGSSPSPSTVATRPATLPPGPTVDPGQAIPRRLRIPSLGVDAPVDPVGVQPDGSMVVPERTRRVGWYRYGPAPGSAQGSAVVAGHVDSAQEGRGALFRLRSADVGDEVRVALSDGRTVRHRVTGKETIVKRRLPTQRLFTREGPPRLVVITCGGPFVEDLGAYRDNVVIVAEPVRST